MLKLMQKTLIALCLLLPLPSIHADEARNKLIEAVIEDQIAAFKAEDAERAFSHASPKIKTIFRNANRFNAMVKRTYGMIYNPEFHQLEEIKEVNGVLVQSAIFVGEDQQTVRAIYQMQLQEDGSWKIDGVYVAPVEDQVT